MGSKRLVSIGMPVYEEERYIGKALEALLGQCFEDFELIISDNGSLDRTREICLEYASIDHRIRYDRTERNIGSSANFNRVFRMTNAKYFFWASGHDLRDKAFISRCVEVLEEDPSVVLCYPKAKWLGTDEQPGEIVRGDVETRGLDQYSGFHTVLWGLGYAYPIYGVMRSEALKRTGLMRNTVGPDIILLGELSLLGAVAQVSEPLLYIRRLPDYGRWDRYVEKSWGARSHAENGWYLYSKWIYEYLSAVLRHTRGLRRRAFMIFSVVMCMVTKYRYVLHGLQSRERSPGVR